MTAPSQANYLLIDGGSRPGALVRLYQRHEAFEIDPLYLSTRWKALYELGPILVKPLPGSTLLSEWLVDEALWADSTLIFSEASIQEVANHLRRLITPPDCHGGSGLLRFADPLVAHFWLSSFSGSDNLHLGPIQHWWVVKPKQTWEPGPQPPWQTFSGRHTGLPWDNRYALLGPDQILALERAQYREFLGRVYAWISERNPSFFLGMSGLQITEWLDSSLTTGQEWGLVTERGLVIWIEACADEGQDFATRPHGHYHTWLTLDSAHACLSPEARIEAFDACRHAHKG
jgi:hypothetical protein